jgi:hypothetical protein
MAKGILKIKSGESIVSGDAVALTGQEIQKTTVEKDRLVIGIAQGPSFKPSSEDLELTDSFQNPYFKSQTPASDPDFINVRTIGLCPDAKVCNEDGSISAGDLLVTANKTGFLKKQTLLSAYDEVIKDYTIAKAVEDASFDGNGEAIIKVYILK